MSNQVSDLALRAVQHMNGKRNAWPPQEKLSPGHGADLLRFRESEKIRYLPMRGSIERTSVLPIFLG